MAEEEGHIGHDKVANNLKQPFRSHSSSATWNVSHDSSTCRVARGLRPEVDFASIDRHLRPTSASICLHMWQNKMTNRSLWYSREHIFASLSPMLQKYDQRALIRIVLETRHPPPSDQPARPNLNQMIRRLVFLL